LVDGVSLNVYISRHPLDIYETFPPVNSFLVLKDKKISGLFSELCV